MQALPGSGGSPVQAVLTDFSRYNTSASVNAPGAEKGITIPVVNAMSEALTVEVRREGRIFRQAYKHGIPQTGLLTVGATGETGTCITFRPDRDVFASGFDGTVIADMIADIGAAYPKLTAAFHPGQS